MMNAIALPAKAIADVAREKMCLQESKDYWNCQLSDTLLRRLSGARQCRK